MFIIAFMGLT